MISYIKGTLEQTTNNSIIVDNNNIGYQVFVSQSTIKKIGEIGDTIKIFTYTHVREDELSLYGFISMEEINMFNLLITVSGIGSKVALGILDTLTPRDLMLAIMGDDFNTLSKCPSVGKKTAQRMALELKDKIKTNDMIVNSATNPQQNVVTAQKEKQDSIDALIALGYSKNEAMKIVLEVALEGMKTEEIIRHALRKLAVQ